MVHAVKTESLAFAEPLVVEIRNAVFQSCIVTIQPPIRQNADAADFGVRLRRELSRTLSRTIYRIYGTYTTRPKMER